MNTALGARAVRTSFRIRFNQFLLFYSVLLLAVLLIVSGQMRAQPSGYVDIATSEAFWQLRAVDEQCVKAPCLTRSAETASLHAQKPQATQSLTLTDTTNPMIEMPPEMVLRLGLSAIVLLLMMTISLKYHHQMTRIKLTGLFVVWLLVFANMGVNTGLLI